MIINLINTIIVVLIILAHTKLYLIDFFLNFVDLDVYLKKCTSRGGISLSLILRGLFGTISMLSSSISL